jgi:hypothetical protein
MENEYPGTTDAQEYSLKGKEEKPSATAKDVIKKYNITYTTSSEKPGQRAISSNIRNNCSLTSRRSYRDCFRS